MIEVGASNRLQQFYQKFNAGKGYYAPAPMARFSIYMTFYPAKTFPQLGLPPEDSFAQAFANSPMQDFTFFVQDITLPEVQTDSSSEGFTTILGDMVVNSQYVKPQSNVFSLRVMNTSTPLAENLFYPWMRETTLPYWSYKSQPYTTAKTMIAMRDVDLVYVFTGCRPQRIQSYQPTHQRDVDMTRDVTMVFNSMYLIDRTSATGGSLMAANVKAAEDAEEAANAEQQKALEWGMTPEGAKSPGSIMYNEDASSSRAGRAQTQGLRNADAGKGAKTTSNAGM